MSRYDNKVKFKEIKKRVSDKEYKIAQKILDTMNLKKIKKRNELALMAEVYSNNGRYEEAMEVLLKMYEKTKTGKILFQMISASISCGEYEDATFYLKEYEKVASDDFYSLIFKYKIGSSTGKSYEELIEILEYLKKVQYIDQWAYELAKLYYKSGLEEKCIDECTDIILWFGEGSYVEKAKILKEYFKGDKDTLEIIEKLKQRPGKSTDINITDNQVLFDENTTDI